LLRLSWLLLLRLSWLLRLLGRILPGQGTGRARQADPS
jgi:hypothetical protein